MKRMFSLAGLVTGAVFALAVGSAQAQVVYAAPYSITTIAGTAGINGNVNANNGSALFGYPEGAAVDASDNIYIVDNLYNTVRKVSPAGGTNWSASTIAGSGSSGSADGTGVSATFYEPTDIALDASNNLYVTDGYYSTIRKLTLTGGSWVVTTIAGSPTGTGSADGTNGAAQFHLPTGIAVDALGNLYVADSVNCIIRKITPSGTNWVVTTIAGTAGQIGGADGTNQGAQFFLPSAVAVDHAGNVYVADGGNNIIRMITPVGTNWVTTTIAGTYGAGAGFTDGTNGDAQFNSPYGLAIDANGILYVADSANNAIRMVAPVGTNWVTTTLAGAPDGSSGSTDGLGSDAEFSDPYGIAVDPAGNLFIGDTFNDIVREGVVATVPNPAIALGANGSVTISWPGPATLQTNSDLSTPAWAAYGGAITSGGGTNSVTFSPATGILFFRLTH